MARRSYGSGRLYVHTDASGAESWYGSWRVGGRRIKRKIGPKRRRGSREGLTRPQVERELRRRMEEKGQVLVRSGLTLTEVADRYLDHLEHVLERKPTTLGDYRSMLHRHIDPAFGDRPVEMRTATCTGPGAAA